MTSYRVLDFQPFGHVPQQIAVGAAIFVNVHHCNDQAPMSFTTPCSSPYGWGFATIELQTKKIKGLHENGFIMAAKINEIAKSLSGEGAN